MRYYSYNEYNPQSPKADKMESHVATMSEEDIRREYWPVWYKKMCEKYEQAYVDECYSFEDCLEDWVIVHWAWEVTK